MIYLCIYIYIYIYIHTYIHTLVFIHSGSITQLPQRRLKDCLGLAGKSRCRCMRGGGGCDTAALGGLGRTFGGGEGFTAARRVQRCLENRVDFKMKNGKSVENTWDIIRFIFVFIYIYITKGFQH